MSRVFEAVPAKLPDGTWGAWVRGRWVEAGAHLLVSAANGNVWPAVVGEVFQAKSNGTLVRTKRAAQPKGATGVHIKQPDGCWRVEVRAKALSEGDIVVVRRKGGDMWRAPVKRIVDQRPGVFVVDLGKKLRMAKPRKHLLIPSNVFRE